MTAAPADPAPAGWRRLVPRSLFARVALIIVVGLAVAQAMTMAAVGYERGTVMRELMMTNIERDLASSIALLDRLPDAERAAWLARLSRPNYRFVLGAHAQGPAPFLPFTQRFWPKMARALQPFPVVAVAQVAGPPEGADLEVRLADGTPVVVQARRVEYPMSGWVPWMLFTQLAVIALCAWAAVRVVTRPLSQLAAAADELGPDLKGRRLVEEGGDEVARAARAFNAMQARIAGYMTERVEILAAISHDLQTPITRMRLRVDLMDDEEVRARLRQDLEVMHALVREGVAYAKTLHGTAEPPALVDLDALFESMVADYEDAGQPVALEGHLGAPVVTRPHALRRIATNLVDNALKFGRDVRLRVGREGGRVTLAVLDRGPGIPPDQLDAVLRPFHRVESSRNRGTGGTGLGLAIAQQLAVAMGAELVLANRDGGGLEARLVLPAPPAPAAPASVLEKP